MSYSITITNTNGLKFRFYAGEVPNTSYSISTKLLKQSLPDDDGDNAIIINLGKEQTLNFPFRLTNTSTDDAAVGTHSSQVNSVKEKIDYLLQTFVTSGVEDLYTIEVQFTANNETGTIPTKKGIVERFSINPTGQNPTFVAGDFSFSIGGGQQ